MANLLNRDVRESLVGFFEFVGVFDDVFRIVADAFEVGYGMERGCKVVVVGVVHFEFGKIDDESCDFFIKEVEFVFVLAELFDVRIIERADYVAGDVVVVKRDFRHIDDFVFGLLNGDRRRFEHMLVDVEHMFFGLFVRFFLVGQNLANEFNR